MLAICFQETGGGIEQPAACSRDTFHASLVLIAPVSYLQLFVTQGWEEEVPGGETAEPSISSSEVIGSNKSIVMSGPESMTP